MRWASPPPDGGADWASPKAGSVRAKMQMAKRKMNFLLLTVTTGVTAQSDGKRFPPNVASVLVTSINIKYQTRAVL